MAVFVAISGPAVTGKTSLVDSLSTYREMSRVKFSPDFHTIVWNDLIEDDIFTEYTEITKDSGYLCTYIYKVVEYYNKYLEDHEDDEGLIVLDSCWLDFAIYAMLNLWYSNAIRTAQEEVFMNILKYTDKISHIYITKASDAKYPVDKHRIRGRFATFKQNRSLEIKLYELAMLLKNSKSLYYSEVSGDSMMIIEDLKKLGYI